MKWSLLTVIILSAAIALMWPALSGNLDDKIHQQRTVTVQQGSLRDVLYEIGHLTPSEPARVSVPLEGKVQWIIEDGSWVDVGDDIFILDDETALSRVSETRNELMQVQQERRLAELRHKNNVKSEAIKLRTALREYDIAKIRHRIQTSPPQGGDALIQIDAKLRPLEEQAQHLRESYEKAYATFRRAESEFLNALEAWHIHRDAILRLESQIEELETRANLDLAGHNDYDVQRIQRAADDLKISQAELAELQIDTHTLRATLDSARNARDATLPEHDQTKAALQTHEESMRELQILAEIEKRGLPLTKMILDREAQIIRQKEAVHQLSIGREAFTSGVISKQQLEDLEQDLSRNNDQLEILDLQIKIQSEPHTPDERAEIDNQLELAQIKAENAQQSHDRAIELSAGEIAVQEAEVARLRFEISRKGDLFASVLQSNIDFAERELSLIDEIDPRREEILSDLAVWQEKLIKAKANPPNIVRAHLAGLVRLDLSRNGEAKQPGDDVNDGDTIARIFTSDDMGVQLFLNQTEVNHVKAGMTALVTVEALGSKYFPGLVRHVSAIGQDKFAEFSQDGAFAGVTEFKTLIELQDSNPAFRQGMTCAIEIELDKIPDATWLPRAAVHHGDSGFFVINSNQETISVEGHWFGLDRFIITKGLRVGDEVIIQRGVASHE